MFNKAYLLVAGAMIAAPAFAQTTAPASAPAAAASTAVKAGATVYDAQGGVVGTIASTDGTNAVVDTGSVKAGIALSSFGSSPKGPTLGLTKAELEAAAGQQAQASAADFKTKMVPGATVYGTAGNELGTIKAVDSQFVTLTTPHGDARLPITGFGPGAKGVTIGLTDAQLAAAMGGTPKP